MTHFRNRSARCGSAAAVHAVATRPFPARWTILAVALSLSGCATAHGTRSTRGGDGSDRTFTAEQIDATGARTAWDACRRLLPQLNFEGGSINHRGQSSVVLTDAVLVVLDGARLADYHTLADIPAEQIQSIRFIGGLQGTTRYGLNSGDGVLIIETKHGL